MSPEERLWCLDGDLPGLTGLMFLGLEDGYHRAPFDGAEVERLGLPGIAFARRPARVGAVQRHLLPGVDGPGRDLGSRISRSESACAIGARAARRPAPP